MNETATSKQLTGRQIVLFDGVCGLCDHFVQLVLDHDKKAIFAFAPLQGDFARNLLERHNIDAADLNSVYLIMDYGTERESLLNRSDAALTILGQLDGAIKTLAIARVFPKPLRDLGYRLVANSRYRIFGKRDACRLPSPEERDRFID